MYRKAIVDALLRALKERPETFKLDEVTLTDMTNGYEYWICSGPANAKLYKPTKFPFGWYHGHRFLEGVEAWHAARIIKTITSPSYDSAKQSHPSGTRQATRLGQNL